jgi:hypothetical protein
MLLSPSAPACGRGSVRLRGAQRKRCPPPDPHLFPVNKPLLGAPQGAPKGLHPPLQRCPPSARDARAQPQAGSGAAVSDGPACRRSRWRATSLGSRGRRAVAGSSMSVNGLCQGGGFSSADPRPPLRGYSAGVVRLVRPRWCPKRWRHRPGLRMVVGRLRGLCRSSAGRSDGFRDGQRLQRVGTPEAPEGFEWCGALCSRSRPARD